MKSPRASFKSPLSSRFSQFSGLGGRKNKTSHPGLKNAYRFLLGSSPLYFSGRIPSHFSRATVIACMPCQVTAFFRFFRPLSIPIPFCFYLRGFFRRFLLWIWDVVPAQLRILVLRNSSWVDRFIISFYLRVQFIPSYIEDSRKFAKGGFLVFNSALKNIFCSIISVYWSRHLIWFDCIRCRLIWIVYWVEWNKIWMVGHSWTIWHCWSNITMWNKR